MVEKWRKLLEISGEIGGLNIRENGRDLRGEFLRDFRRNFGVDFGGLLEFFYRGILEFILEMLLKSFE